MRLIGSVGCSRCRISPFVKTSSLLRPLDSYDTGIHFIRREDRGLLHRLRSFCFLMMIGDVIIMQPCAMYAIIYITEKRSFYISYLAESIKFVSHLIFNPSHPFFCP